MNDTPTEGVPIPVNLKTTKGRQAPLCMPINCGQLPVILPDSLGNEKVKERGDSFPFNLRITKGRQTPLCTPQMCVMDDIGIPLYDGGFFALEDNSGVLCLEDQIGLLALEN